MRHERSAGGTRGLETLEPRLVLSATDSQWVGAETLPGSQAEYGPPDGMDLWRAENLTKPSLA